MRIAITSGYFDPMHRGHLELLQLSRAQGDALWVIVNTDAQAALKKGKAFIDQDTRLAVTAALRMVDRAVLAIDTDGSVCATLDKLITDAKALGCEAVFCKGGDRNAGNIPEMTVLKKHGAMLIEGLGAKIDSSSRIISEAQNNSTKTK
jgi:D-beta-D-heptose 7-phosphate kinase/D-beta-D-heptose 1-phosphate adenosyltransferase